MKKVLIERIHRDDGLSVGIMLMDERSPPRLIAVPNLTLGHLTLIKHPSESLQSPPLPDDLSPCWSFQDPTRWQDIVFDLQEGKPMTQLRDDRFLSVQVEPEERKWILNLGE